MKTSVITESLERWQRYQNLLTKRWKMLSGTTTHGSKIYHHKSADSSRKRSKSFKSAEKGFLASVKITVANKSLIRKNSVKIASKTIATMSKVSVRNLLLLTRRLLDRWTRGSRSCATIFRTKLISLLTYSYRWSTAHRTRSKRWLKTEENQIGNKIWSFSLRLQAGSIVSILIRWFTEIWSLKTSSLTNTVV